MTYSINQNNAVLENGSPFYPCPGKAIHVHRYKLLVYSKRRKEEISSWKAFEGTTCGGRHGCGGIGADSWYSGQNWRVLLEEKLQVLEQLSTNQEEKEVLLEGVRGISCGGRHGCGGIDASSCRFKWNRRALVEKKLQALETQVVDYVLVSTENHALISI